MYLQNYLTNIRIKISEFTIFCVLLFEILILCGKFTEMANKYILDGTEHTFQKTKFEVDRKVFITIPSLAVYTLTIRAFLKVLVSNLQRALNHIFNL